MDDRLSTITLQIGAAIGGVGFISVALYKRIQRMDRSKGTLMVRGSLQNSSSHR